MSKPEKSSVDRRSFLKGAAAGAAALMPKPPIAAQQVAQTRVDGAALAAETSGPAAKVDVMTLERPGSDFMLDVIKSLGIEYCCANPGSSFRALHESIINYGGNKNPEMITCCHEESSVAMAHGFAKIEGKPIMALAHGTVGVQHAAMAIYNAYVDRVPVYIVLGNILDATFRRDQVEWNHAVQDAASMVRDYVKWDDTPVSLAHFAESAVRAYKIAMTPPLEPVVIVADATLQEEPIKETNLRIPRLSLASPPQGDSGAVAEAAKLLVAAENPLIVAGRAARTPNGVKLLVELAETLQAPIQDQRLRMNFPTRHPLFGAGNVRNSDVILGLEAMDFWGLVHQQSSFNRTGIQETSLIKPGTKLISITALDLNHKANYQDFGRFEDVDLAIAADAEATLPSLIEACKRLITPDRRRALQERGAKLAQASQRVRDRDRELAAVGWDSSPISVPRMTMEVWAQIKNEDWSLVSNVSNMMSHWPTRMWNFDKYYQYIGVQGANGIGYGAPAAVGAALANKKYGRLSVNFQCDGDLNYAPSVLWTAAHHRIPMLTLMHNNRGYHQELMQVQTMANRANRGIEKAHIGTTIDDPNIDYAYMAKAYGIDGQGPITDPKDLGPAIKRAIDVVKRGEPALIDVVTQPR